MTHILKIQAKNRYIFEAIKSGEKKVETRAATSKYKNIKSGDVLKFVCGKISLEKEVTKVFVFKNIGTLLHKYEPEEINPKTHSKEDSENMYYSFPGYREKIKKYGIVAFELK